MPAKVRLKKARGINLAVRLRPPEFLGRLAETKEHAFWNKGKHRLSMQIIETVIRSIGDLSREVRALPPTRQNWLFRGQADAD